MLDHPEFRSLHREILLNPGDNLPRLLLADWLEDHGRGEDADIIRMRVERPDWISPWSTRLGAAMGRLLGFGPATIRPQYRMCRGFASHIALPLVDFRRHAKELFSLHPITEVVLTDREPIELEHDIWAWWSPCATGPRDHADLPRALYMRLRYGSQAVRFDRAAAWYTTRDLALSALSAACVHYGRRRALGLEHAALPSPQPA